MKDFVSALLIVIGCAVLIVVFSAIIGFGFLGLQLPWENMQTKIIHQTNQYTTSATTQMQLAYHDYTRLQVTLDKETNPSTQNDLRCQQLTDYQTISDAASKIDPSLVPPDIQAFLSGHNESTIGCQQ